MKQKSEITELTDEIVNFIHARGWDTSKSYTAENLTKSISIEAAELLECFQWGGDFDQHHTEQELADVMIYCLQLARKLGVEPEKIIREKMKYNGERYPAKK